MRPPAMQQMSTCSRSAAPCSPSSACRPIRSRATASSTSRRRSTRQGHPPRARPGREAQARGCAVEPRHHRPLRADARHLSGAARNGGPGPERSSSPTACASCCGSAIYAYEIGVAPRRGQQARVPAGGGLLRARRPELASRSARTYARKTSSAAAPTETESKLLA